MSAHSTNQVKRAFDESKSSTDFAKRYLEHLKRVLDEVNPAELGAFIDEIWNARERGSMVFFLGNGGSAATASHFVNDLTIGTRSFHKPFRAMCLSDNIAGLTAIGNDYGYEHIFILPLRAHYRPGDVVVAISASGNSPNIVKAMEWANEQGALTIGLTGFDGGKLKQMSKMAVHVPSAKGEYGPVEDAHMIFDHLTHAYLSYQAAAELNR